MSYPALQDETGDLVTISPNSGVWYDTDFYLVSSGEGIAVKPVQPLSRLGLCGAHS